MKGILLIGHGSRSQDAQKVFNRIIEELGKKLQLEVQGCSMEISAPFIPETIEKMVQRGVRHITVLPYFLYSGIHIKEDIPEILTEMKERYKDIEIIMAEPLGYHDTLIDILVERLAGETTCI
jgi:sirohydrochlorin cobaltochelatase